MHGIIFGDKHTFRDFGLLLKSRPEISPPSPKLKLIKVPGSNKVIDLTESLTGEVKYETRQITAEFYIVDDRARWPILYSNILTYLHGKSVRIIMDDDPNYFYTGRVTVEELKPDKKIATLTITAEVEPYKRERFGEGRCL